MFVFSRSKRTLTVNAGYMVNSPSRIMTRSSTVVAQFIGHRGIFTSDAAGITVFHSDHDRMLEHTILRREVVAQDITDEHPIDGGRCSKDLAFGQVAPFSLLVIAPVAGVPVPMLVEGGSHIAALGGGDVNRFCVAHQVINLVGQTENLVVVGAHAFSHQIFVDADHMPMTYFQFLNKEGQQWDAKADLARFGGGEVVGDRRPRLHEVMPEGLRERGEGAFPVMFQETNCDACMLSQDGARYPLREVFT